MAETPTVKESLTVPSSDPVAATETMIHDLRGLHAQTTPGVWGKGQTTHHTVAKREGSASYRIAEFHHAVDAMFCDAAHAFVPALLAQLEAAQRDQARYRYFRDGPEEWEMFDSRWLSQIDIYGQGPTDMDAAIDAKLAAMAEKQEGRQA